MVYGDSNSGKTYMVMHLALCVAAGHPWLGREVERGIVIYIACESATSIRRRYVAHCKHFGREVRDFGMVPDTVNLMDPSADVDGVIEIIQERMLECAPDPVQLVIVDTLARAMAGGNENAGEDMSKLVQGVDRIREVTGAHVLLIHHSGKNQALGARGHSSLRAALDTELEVTCAEGSNIHTARITKQRDLDTKGETVSARFVCVELGRNQWGRPITACALEDVDPAEVQAPQRKASGAGAKDGRSAQAVLAYLLGQKAAVRAKAIVEALGPAGISKSSVYRAVNDLIDAGCITSSLGMIYAPKTGEAP